MGKLKNEIKELYKHHGEIVRRISHITDKITANAKKAAFNGCTDLLIILPPEEAPFYKEIIHYYQSEGFEIELDEKFEKEKGFKKMWCYVQLKMKLID